MFSNPERKSLRKTIWWPQGDGCNPVDTGFDGPNREGVISRWIRNEEATLFAGCRLLNDFITAEANNSCLTTMVGGVSLQRDRFNPLDFFGGECELFGLEVFFHMLLARGSGQREHPDLHGKPKDDLCGTSP